LDKKRIAAAAQAIGLAVIVGLLVVHTAWWHADGEHARIFADAREGEELKAVLYNLALMFVSGIGLGLFMMRATNALGYDVPELDHFPGDDAEADRTESSE